MKIQQAATKAWHSQINFCWPPNIVKWSEVRLTQSCPTLCDLMDYTVRGILQARILEWVAFPFSRGIFPTQGLNPGLLYCRWILYQLNYQGSPIQYCRLFELEGPYPATHPSQEFYSVSKGSHHNLLKHSPNLEAVIPVLQSFPSFFLSFFLFGRRMFKKYRKRHSYAHCLEWTSTNV